MKKKLLSTYLLIICLNLTFSQNYYEIAPRGCMALGQGFSRNDLSQAKQTAISFDVHKTANGATSTSYFEALANDTRSLNQALGLSVSVDASFLTTDVKTSYSYNQSVALAANSISLVITAQSEYGMFTMDNIKLNSTANDLLNLKKYDEFFRIFGTHYVVKERRGASASAIVTILNLDQREAQGMGISAGVSVGFGPVTASARAAFQQTLKTASKQGRVNIQIVSTGGPGIGALSDMFKGTTGSDSALSEIRKALGTYMASFNIDNSAPIGFHTSSMTDFISDNSLQQPDDIWAISKEEEFEEITQKFRQMYSAKKAFKMRLQDTSITGRDRSQTRKAIDLYDAYLSKLEKAHADCKSSSTAPCRLPEPDSMLPPPPKLPNLPLISWRIKLGNSYSSKASSTNIIRDFEKTSTHNSVVKESHILFNDVYLVVEGEKLTTALISFEDNPIKAYQADKNDKLIALHGAYYMGDEPVFCLTDEIEKLFQSGKSMGKGRFFISVNDVYGRTTKQLIAQAIWDNSGPNNTLRIAYLRRVMD